MIFNKKNNFINVEYNYTLNLDKNISLKQLNYELDLYYQGYVYNEILFREISDLIYLEISKEKSIFSLEYLVINNLINISIKIISGSKINFCYKKFVSEIITNWIILGFLNKITDNSYTSNDYIYISRYDFIENFLKNLTNFFVFFILDYNETQEDQKHYKFFISNLISFLCAEKKLYKTGLYKYYNKTKKNYIFLGIKNNKNYKQKYNLKIYLTQPTIHQTKQNNYFMGLHYSSLNIIFKKNKKSGSLFKLKSMNLLDSLKTLKYYIDKNFYYLILDELKKEFNCNEFLLEETINKKIEFILKQDTVAKNIINKKIYLNSEKFNIFLDDPVNDEFDLNNEFDFGDLLEDIIEIPDITDDFYYKNTLDGFDENEDFNKSFKKNIINHFIINNYSSNSNVLNKYYNYLIFIYLKTIIENFDYFYLSYSLDFRGRIYSNSYVSPMGDKLFRFIYYNGIYSNSELNSKNNYNFSKEILDLLSNSFLIKNFPNINFNYNIDIQYMYWGLFELGKMFKSDLLQKNNGILNELDFISYGDKILERFIKNDIVLSFNEKIEIMSILHMFRTINKNYYKKQIIYKDATASGIQLLTVILGAVNEKILKICNLNSVEYWYDTYFFIIEMFKNTEDIKNLFIKENDLIKKLLTRKILKKITMVYGYNVSYYSGEKYFKDEVKLSIKDIEKIDINLKTTSLIFSLYFKFLNSIFKEQTFYKTPLKSVVEIHQQLLKKKGFIKTNICDNSQVDFSYFYPLNFNYDRIYKKKRTRIKFNFPSNNVDENKTIRAFIANLTHSTDAVYIRYVLENLNRPIITIHDSFGIDILNITDLINAANFSINKIYYSNSLNKINTNYYSKYILI